MYPVPRTPTLETSAVQWVGCNRIRLPIWWMQDPKHAALRPMCLVAGWAAKAFVSVAAKGAQPVAVRGEAEAMSNGAASRSNRAPGSANFGRKIGHKAGMHAISAATGGAIRAWHGIARRGEAAQRSAAPVAGDGCRRGARTLRRFTK